MEYNVSAHPPEVDRLACCPFPPIGYYFFPNRRSAWGPLESRPVKSCRAIPRGYKCLLSCRSQHASREGSGGDFLHPCGERVVHQAPILLRDQHEVKLAYLSKLCLLSRRRADRYRIIFVRSSENTSTASFLANTSIWAQSCKIW